jgi:hypothetical protein
MKRAALALAVVLAVVPSVARGETVAELSDAYCEAVLTNDIAPLFPLLSRDLRGAVEGWGASPLPLTGIEAPAASCMRIRTAGTAASPEAIVEIRYGVAAVRMAITVVAAETDGVLRIVDVRYADGGTLRDRLAAGR